MDENVELMNRLRICGNMIKRTRMDGKYLPNGQGRIMYAVFSNDGVTQSELAQILKIRPQSLTRVLVQLEEQGLIIRKREEQDRRNISVYITEEGKKHHQTIIEERNRVSDEMFDCLNGKEKNELKTLLDRVIDSYNSRNSGEQK